MKFIPFLIAAFLLINPFLEWILRKFDIQAEKLQFWVMLTSGTAWVLGLINIFLDSTGSRDQAVSEGVNLLPRLAFSLDWISGALVLSALGLVFATVLTREEDPQANAWLAGLGGACVIGLESNSAYTLGLAWTIIESFHFYFSYRDKQIITNPIKFLPGALTRLSAPAVMILFSLTQSESGRMILFSELDPRSGPVLIAAGLLGFLGWFLSFQGFEVGRSRHFPGATENWLPGLLGLLLILRGAVILGGGPSQGLTSLILSMILFGTVLAGILLDLTPGAWFLSCGLLVSISAFISSAESALSWTVVMVLPGIRMWIGSRNPRASLIPLILAGIGLLPLPFLPSWAGVSAFRAGIPGIFLGLSYGMLVGSVLIIVLKNWGSSKPDSESFPLLVVIGAIAILASQIVISLRLDLVDGSRGLLGKPITIWISILGLLPVLLLGNYLPLKQSEKAKFALSRMKGGSGKTLPGFVHFMDRLVSLFSGIFEGQAGLVWALLIGLLLITLISAGGG